MVTITKPNLSSSHMPVVGRVEINDIEPLSLLFKEVVAALPYYNEIAKKSEMAKYSPELLLESITDDPDSVLVAKIEGKLAGFCLSRDDDGLIWLSWFGVHDSYRRRGIGSALLQKLEDTVRNRKSHKIWCDCRTENSASKVVLKNCGYRQICTVQNHWYGQDFILWEKFVK
jgi:ribosomal protein S18 acetylase RimI-like enzyme